MFQTIVLSTEHITTTKNHCRVIGFESDEFDECRVSFQLLNRVPNTQVRSVTSESVSSSCKPCQSYGSARSLLSDVSALFLE